MFYSEHFSSPPSVTGLRSASCLIHCTRRWRKTERISLWGNDSFSAWLEPCCATARCWILKKLLIFKLILNIIWFGDASDREHCCLRKKKKAVHAWKWSVFSLWNNTATYRYPSELALKHLFTNSLLDPHTGWSHSSYWHRDRSSHPDDPAQCVWQLHHVSHSPSSQHGDELLQSHGPGQRPGRSEATERKWTVLLKLPWLD